MAFDRLKSSSAVVSLKSAFDTRLATVVCLLMAIAAKSIISWIYLDLETDKSLFLLFAKSFLDSGVFAEPIRDAGSGNFVYVYNSAVVTPFYSLVAVPLLFITKSYVATDFAISILGWSLLFPALFRLARLLFEKRWLANFFLLLVAFYLYPHEMESPPKDTLAAAFSLWTILLTQMFLQKVPRIGITMLLALSVACIFLVKLTYVPAAATSVLLLFIFVVLKRSRKHTIHFLLFSAVLLAIGLAIYGFVYLPAYRLSNPVMDKLGRDGVPLVRGFYLENLVYMFPFVSSSVFNINFWGVQIEQKTHLSFVNVMKIFRLVDAVAVLVLASGILFYFRRIFRNKLYLSLIVVSSSIVISLFWMSSAYALTHPDKYSLNLWTYAAEARFYLLPILVLQLFLLRTVFKAKRFKFIRGGILFFLLFEAIHGLYFDTKQTMNLATIKNKLQNKSPVKKAASLALQLSQSNADFGLVTTDNFLRRYAELKNIKTYAISKAPVAISWANKRSQFLVVTHPQDTSVLSPNTELQLNKADTVLPFVFQYGVKN